MGRVLGQDRATFGGVSRAAQRTVGARFREAL